MHMYLVSEGTDTQPPLSLAVLSEVLWMYSPIQYSTTPGEHKNKSYSSTKPKLENNEWIKFKW